MEVPKSVSLPYLIRQTGAKFSCQHIATTMVSPIQGYNEGQYQAHTILVVQSAKLLDERIPF